MCNVEANILGSDYREHRKFKPKVSRAIQDTHHSATVPINKFSTKGVSEQTRASNNVSRTPFHVLLVNY